MSISALIMMIISIVTIPGGLIICLSIALKKNRKNLESK